MTTFQTGTQNISPNYQYNWRVVSTLIATSQVYNYSFGGLRVWRSNAGTAMTDTLPVIASSSADNEPGAIWNGWYIDIINTDATAALTLSAPTGVTFNGVSAGSVTLNPGASISVYSDGNNYYTLSNSTTGAFVNITGSPVNLGTAVSNNGIVNRSNAGTAMADTLPNANTLPIGWRIILKNVDASATDTITPATSTINGASTLAVTHGQTTTIWSDGTNYWASTPA